MLLTLFGIIYILVSLCIFTTIIYNELSIIKNEILSGRTQDVLLIFILLLFLLPFLPMLTAVYYLEDKYE